MFCSSLYRWKLLGASSPPPLSPPPSDGLDVKKIIYCKINCKLYSAKTFFDQLFILGCFAKEFQSKYCMPSPECGMYSWAGCLEVRWQFLTVVKILKYIEVFLSVFGITSEILYLHSGWKITIRWILLSNHRTTDPRLNFYRELALIQAALQGTYFFFRGVSRVYEEGGGGLIIEEESVCTGWGLNMGSYT